MVDKRKLDIFIFYIFTKNKDKYVLKAVGNNLIFVVFFFSYILVNMLPRLNIMK